MRVLLVEDEAGISGFIKDGLEEESFAVDVAFDGKHGLQLAMDNLEHYDVVLLDWMLPGLSGIEICKIIRKENTEVPIIFLTAKDTSDDAVFAFEAGASDFMRKPFSFEELLARMRALLRTRNAQQDCLTYDDIKLNVDAHTVTQNGMPIELTQKEFALLEYLLRNEGKVCRRTRIIEKIWDVHFDKDTSVIDVYINSLRKKFGALGSNSFIKTLRGVGYKVE